MFNLIRRSQKQAQSFNNTLKYLSTIHQSNDCYSKVRPLIDMLKFTRYSVNDLLSIITNNVFLGHGLDASIKLTKKQLGL